MVDPDLVDHADDDGPVKIAAGIHADLAAGYLDMVRALPVPDKTTGLAFHDTSG